MRHGYTSRLNRATKEWTRTGRRQQHGAQTQQSSMNPAGSLPSQVEGARYVSSFPLIFSNQKPGPFFGGPPGENVLDGGAPFYDLYQCKDGKWMSV